MGDACIAWTARLAMLCYFGRLAADLALADAALRDRWARRIWTAGLAIFLLHTFAAFHFLHGWSQTHALDHTARRTYEQVGIRWGGGLYINYAFGLIWIADVLLWNFLPRTRRALMPGWTWFIHDLFAFMVFNATVVLGPAYWKWIFPPALALLAGLFFRRHRTIAPQH